jgi:hypothetical protein
MPRADAPAAGVVAAAVIGQWVVVVALTRFDAVSLALTGAATALAVVAALRIGGVAFAALAAAVWVVLPAALPFWRGDFRPHYRDEVLSVLYGLDDRSRLVVSILLLAALVLALGPRTLERAAAAACAAAGVLLGALTLGLSPVAFHWHDLTQNLLQVREYGWSVRLVEYLPLAGLFGAFRRSRLVGALLGAWLLVGIVLPLAHARPGGFPVPSLRAIVPGLPAYLLLTACVVYLVPGWARRPELIRVRAAWPRATQAAARGRRSDP